MGQGTIKKIVSDRGFGFISAEGGDVFFHHSAVLEGRFDDLHEGQNVEYELESEEARQGSRHSAKGPRAVSVKPT